VWRWIGWHPDGVAWQERLARGYLGAQAVAGALWWIAVFASTDVRRWTLGAWDPAWVVGPDLLLFVGASAVASMRGDRVIAAVAAAWTTAIALALVVYGLVERTAGWGALAMVVAAVGSLAAAATIWLGRLPLDWFFVGPFAFRPAAARSGARNIRRSLTQLVIFWSAFFVAVPLVVTTAEHRLRLDWPALDRGWLDALGAAIFVSASALGLWSCITMAVRGEGTPLPAETARALVVSGPYRWVRNPMAVAGGLQTAAMGLVVGSWLVVAIAAAGAVAWHTLIRPQEEADLIARFGDPYLRYRSAVRCWVPTTGDQS
jgi:protein-S-isoprenylcysteine O-methyltransferase Ste14